MKLRCLDDSEHHYRNTNGESIEEKLGQIYEKEGRSAMRNSSIAVVIHYSEHLIKSSLLLDDKM